MVAVKLSIQRINQTLGEFKDLLLEKRAYSVHPVRSPTLLLSKTIVSICFSGEDTASILIELCELCHVQYTLACGLSIRESTLLFHRSLVMLTDVWNSNELNVTIVM